MKGSLSRSYYVLRWVAYWILSYQIKFTCLSSLAINNGFSILYRLLSWLKLGRRQHILFKIPICLLLLQYGLIISTALNHNFWIQKLLDLLHLESFSCGNYSFHHVQRKLLVVFCITDWSLITSWSIKVILLSHLFLNFCIYLKVLVPGNQSCWTTLLSRFGIYQTRSLMQLLICKLSLANFLIRKWAFSQSLTSWVISAINHGHH